MDRFDIQDALETYRVIADTREQANPRAAERFAALGPGLERATLSYGDYCANVTFPDGRDLYDISGRISPACVIERKMSLDEAAACLTRERDRFEREFCRARDANAKIYLLIEDAGGWDAIRRHEYRSRFRPKAFIASLTAWMARYDATVIFCRPGYSGQMIREILYRDIKERLGRGEYG